MNFQTSQSCQHLSNHLVTQGIFELHSWVNSKVSSRNAWKDGFASDSVLDIDLQNQVILLHGRNPGNIWATLTLNMLSSLETIWMFPKIVGFPSKSSILIGFSIINHPFWGLSPYFWKHPYKLTEFFFRDPWRSSKIGGSQETPVKRAKKLYPWQLACFLQSPWKSKTKQSGWSLGWNIFEGFPILPMGATFGRLGLPGEVFLLVQQVCPRSWITWFFQSDWNPWIQQHEIWVAHCYQRIQLLLHVRQSCATTYIPLYSYRLHVDWDLSTCLWVARRHD